MPIKYSTYDSSSGNTFALTTITGVSGTFTNQVSGALYKTTGGVVVVSGSGDIRPFGLFSFPTESGSSGTFLSATTGGNTEWAPGSFVNYQLFNSNGTWTKPPGVSVVYVELIGGGGGGNSGYQHDSGVTVLNRGGAGGNGGPFLSQVFLAASLSGSVNITVGAGGSGGPSQTVVGTGFYGSYGGNSSFGDYLTTISGALAANPNQSNAPSYQGITNLTQSVGGGGTVASTGGTSLYVGAGGGGGGATNPNGGRGGFARFLTTVGSGVAPGLDAVANEGGGGGGGIATGNSGTKGGNGAYPGGGGGGGGVSLSGFSSGAGGDGAPGYVKIISW